MIFFKRCCYSLIVIEVLLGFAHLLWPHYEWGQGRRSYFNFNNTLTFASWLASMQLVVIAILALISFHRERHQLQSRSSPIWICGALVALIVSIAEITRFHYRLKLLGYPELNVYEQFVVIPLWLSLLGLFGWFLLSKLRAVPAYFKYGVGWLLLWGVVVFLTILSHIPVWYPHSWDLEFALIMGLAYLFGGTLLLLSLGGYVLQQPLEAK